MTERQFLITGMPRSGTRFMTALFRSAGLSASHEGLFGPLGPNKNVIKNVESSWMSVPYLKEYKHQFKKIIHITRHPLYVLASLKRRNFFGRIMDKYDYFVWNHLKSIVMYDNSITAIIQFWIDWNKKIERYADVRVQIEDINENKEKFFENLGINIKGKELYKNEKCNTDGETNPIDLGLLKTAGNYKLFKEKAKEYGYDLEP